MSERSFINPWKKEEAGVKMRRYPLPYFMSDDPVETRKPSHEMLQMKQGFDVCYFPKDDRLEMRLNPMITKEESVPIMTIHPFSNPALFEEIKANKGRGR